MTTKRLPIIVGLLAGLVAQPADAQDWEFSGNIDLESRVFIEDEQHPGQDDDVLQLSLSTELEWRWRSEDGNQRISFIPFLRADGTDDERSHIDIREAYWAYEGDGWDILLGVNKVFWGVTESVHLVDIINQTDLVEDLDQEDKLGQPMINLNIQKDWGLISAFVLPYFRERTFPGEDGRFRTPIVVDTDTPVYESSAEENHVDVALRYSHYFGNVDVGAYYYTGTSREPRFVPDIASGKFRPVYDQIDQIGIDLQYTGDAWLWKLETILRDGAEDQFFAAVGGFEYTFYQIAESDADLGVLMEYQYDGRDDNEPFTLADNDIFVAARLSMNDTQDTAVLAGFSVDPDTSELFFNLEAERRFGDTVFAELRARFFTGADPGELLFSFERDDYIQLRLSKYF